MWEFLFTLFVSLVRGFQTSCCGAPCTVPWGLSSSTHTFYKHRWDSSANLVLHIVSHCHCTGWMQPQLTASLTVWHHFYSLRAEGVVRGREGHNEGKEHRNGHWKEQGKGEDEGERGMEGWNETEEGERVRERGRGWRRRQRERGGRERERERERDTETDTDEEGGYVSSNSTETRMWLGQPAVSST